MTGERTQYDKLEPLRMSCGWVADCLRGWHSAASGWFAVCGLGLT